MAKHSSLKNFGHDKTSVANMPQEVHQQEFPKCDYIHSDLDDSIEGIDQVVEHSKGKAKKTLSYQK